MIMRLKFFAPSLFCFFFLLHNHRAFAWSEHPLMAYPVLKGIPELVDADQVTARSINGFLVANEKGLEKILEEFEQWARLNLAYYPPLPAELKFKASGNYNDVLDRFLKAIRINPEVKLPLYIHLLPGQVAEGSRLISPASITTLKDVGSMLKTNYLNLNEGEKISPLSVLLTANDEPDYGLDLGLFEDNGTAHGQKYGFGRQPFGDPTLDFGSQAPFHMGFFHEPRIVTSLAPFLEKSLIEYRIQKFKTLSIFAFQNGEYYWGWRFMGWGMHYIGDLTMPYHAVALPGYSPLRMIWINFKAMLGFTRARDNAIRLVSNRHLVIEAFQRQLLRSIYIAGDFSHPLIQSLSVKGEVIPYSIRFPRVVVAYEAASRATLLNNVVVKWLPSHLVNDPTLNVDEHDDLKRVVSLTRDQFGDGAVEQLIQALIPSFQSFNNHLRSFFFSVKQEEQSQPFASSS